MHPIARAPIALISTFQAKHYRFSRLTGQGAYNSRSFYSCQTRLWPSFPITSASRTTNRSSSTIVMGLDEWKPAMASEAFSELSAKTEPADIKKEDEESHCAIKVEATSDMADEVIVGSALPPSGTMQPRRSRRLSGFAQGDQGGSIIGKVKEEGHQSRKKPRKASAEPELPSVKGEPRKSKALAGITAAERPRPEECWYATRALAAIHHDVSLQCIRKGTKQDVEDPALQTLLEAAQPDDRKTVLDSLVRTMLSQNTTDILSRRAYNSLKEAFPEWEAVRKANPADIEAAIRCGGRAATLTERFQVILNTLVEERGECSLEYVRQMTDAEVKEELSRFKGVGSKTISCVMMFCLQRPEFPVDTHVWRISKNMGWVPKNASREEAYEHLNSMVPEAIKFDLHVLLVEHGKRCKSCAKNGRPRKEALVEACPLTQDRLRAAVLLKDEEAGS